MTETDNRRDSQERIHLVQLASEQRFDHTPRGPIEPSSSPIASSERKKPKVIGMSTKPVKHVARLHRSMEIHRLTEHGGPSPNA